MLLSESMGRVDTGAISGSEEVTEKREKNESIDMLRGGWFVSSLARYLPGRWELLDGISLASLFIRFMVGVASKK